MGGWLTEIDDLLRGKKGDPDLLARGTEHLKLSTCLATSVVLGVIYGASMGLYAVLSRDPRLPLQLPASAVKVPALFLLTLVVCFPSLYVFGALLGAQLRPLAALRLIMAAITVNLAVLASFAPITAFFTLTTASYHFMKLLNVGFFAAAGAAGLWFLVNMMARYEAAQDTAAEPAAEDADQEAAEMERDAEAAGLTAQPTVQPAAGAAAGLPPVGGVGRRAPAGRPGRALFKVWLAVYALVGAQMAWILRPFIGSPDLEFAWFRQRGGNIFVNVLETIGLFLSGK